MSIIAAEFKPYLTSGSTSGTFQGGTNSNVDTSLGGQLSSSLLADERGNLWSSLTPTQLTGPTTLYRCIGFILDNATDQLEVAHLMSEELSTLPSGASVKFAVQTNDQLDTPCPVCANENTAPVGLTFFSPFASTGDDEADYSSAYPIGPLNSAADGSTELTFDDSIVMFLYIELTLNGVTTTINSSDIGYRLAGDESLV